MSHLTATDYSSPIPTPDYGETFPAQEKITKRYAQYRRFSRYYLSISTAFLLSTANDAYAQPACDLSACPPIDPNYCATNAAPYTNQYLTQTLCQIDTQAPMNVYWCSNPSASCDAGFCADFRALNEPCPTPAPAPTPTPAPLPSPSPSPTPAPSPAPTAAPLGYKYGGEGIEWYPATPAPTPAPAPAPVPAPGR